MDARTSRYHEVYARCAARPGGLLGRGGAGDRLVSSRPKKVFDTDAGIYGRWFAGAVCNTCCNALDRHVERGRGDAAGDHLRLAGHRHASAPSPTRSCSTEVQTLAAILQDFGVEQGDRVILYMPMVPEAVFAMLACARIGAVHSAWCSAASRRRSSRPASTTPSRSSSCRRPAASRRARVVKYKPLLDDGDRARDAQAARLPDPAAPAGEGRR